jgi:hypothetical protein
MRQILLLSALAFSVPASWARPFSLVVYNVENLFDADGVAVYDDYQPSKYTPAHFVTKLTHITQVLAKVDKGAGPDIILFNEIEADQTPDSTVSDVPKWLAKYDTQTFSALLSPSPLPSELAGCRPKCGCRRRSMTAACAATTLSAATTSPAPS